MSRITINQLCLVLVLLLVSCHQDTNHTSVDDMDVCFAQSDDTTLVVHPFVCKGQQCVVLPSYWDSTRMVVAKDHGTFKPYVRTEMGKWHLMQSKLPTIFIRTESGDMEYVNVQKSNKESGRITVVDTLGNVEYEGVLENIHGRGDATWMQKKRPYSIKLPRKMNLLGLKKAKKYNLLSQLLDPTGLRNWIALSAARQMGLNSNMEWTYANVYLNGKYGGCYLVTNKVKRGIRDGFLLEIDYRDMVLGYPSAVFPLKHGGYMIVKIPEHPDEEQVAYIQRAWQQVEQALIDDAKGKQGLLLDSLIDVDSFIANYLCQEVFMNMDAGTSSFFLAKSPAGKFIADPLWDMDMSMHSPKSILLGHELCRVIYAGAGVCPDSEDYNGVWGMLYKNSEFRYRVFTSYFERMRPVVNELLWGETWTNICAQLQADMEIDNMRWRDGIDFEDQCKQMRKWMAERMSFLDLIWDEENSQEMCTVTLQIPHTPYESIHLLQYVVPKNAAFTEPLPSFETIATTGSGYEYTFTGYMIDGKSVDLDTLVVNRNLFVLGTWKQTKEPEFDQKVRNWWKSFHSSFILHTTFSHP